MHVRPAILAPLTALFLTMSAPGQAQIVDIQGQMSNDPVQGTSIGAAFSGQLRSGQTESILVGAASSIEHYIPGHHLFFSISMEWGDTEGTTYVDRRFVHLRYRRPKGTLGQVESFLQTEEDGIRGLRARSLAGLGLRWTLDGNDSSRFSMGVSGMWEHEMLASGHIAPGQGNTESLVRISSYATGEVKIAEGWTVGTTTYVQPKATDPGDLRLLSNSSLRVAPGGRAALETHLHLTYDNRPPSGIEPLDIVLKQALSLSF